MFSKSLNLRLAAVFSGIFLAGTLLLFAGTYLLLYSSVRREHLQQVQSRLLEFWAMYQTGGIAALKAEVVAEKNQESRRPFLLRVVGSDNATLFLYVPPPWRHFHFRRLEEGDPARPQAFLRLPLADGKGALELAGLRLDDGNWLQVGFHSVDWQELLVRFRQVFILIAAPLLVLSFLGGALASSRALRPVQHLNRAFQSIIRTGRLDARVPERGAGGELDDLVSLYNGMLAKIETLVNGMRDALDNVAHDLRTPLARLKAAAETALAGPPAGQRRALESCLEETQIILTMLNTLMDISEAETGAMRLAPTRVPLASLIEDLRELYGYVAAERGIRLEARVPRELEVDADLNRLRQVIANLLDNALKYTPAGGRVDIEASGGEDGVRIVVRDTGPGIPAEELPHIWERLYRGDRSRSTPGLGLGLSLVQAIVRAHGGTVAARSLPEAGAEFTVRLPPASRWPTSSSWSATLTNV
jgi:signal transduction histidine kinase